MSLALAAFGCGADGGASDTGSGDEQVCAAALGCDSAETPDAGSDCGGATTMACGEADAAVVLPPPALRDALVTVAQLSSDAADDTIVLDARSESAYAAGHLPGARSLPAGRLRAVVDGVPGQLPTAPEAAATLGEVGLDARTPVVVYADRSDLSAARLLWSLQVMGHAEVRLLDGGYDAYVAAGLPTTGDARPVSPSTFPLDAVDAERRVDTAWVLAHLSDPEVVLIDARSAGEYAEAHIPGAEHFDWTGNVDAGRLRSPAALRARFAELPTGATLVTYCQTGSRAAMAYFALHYLGYGDVRLYDGSMAAWTADAGRPLE